MASTKANSKITPSDIESKLRSLQGDVQEKVEEQKSNVYLAAGIGALLLVVAFYFLGRRSGKRRSTLVEIKRV